jgi:Nuclease-related domain
MLALPFVDSGFVRGLLTGVVFTAVVGSLAFWVVQVTGTASVMMGDLGEQWTASELRRLRRDGWRVVNHVRLSAWDIDHVLVGPGGVFAVETKWSATAWRFDPFEDRILAAVRQARENAKRLGLWTDLRSLGWVRLKQWCFCGVQEHET